MTAHRGTEEVGAFMKAAARVMTLVVAAVLAGCSNSGGGVQGEPEAEPSGSPLLGTRWVLGGYGPATAPRAVPAGVEVTALFTRDADAVVGKVTGTAGCNRYHGSFNVSGHKIHVGRAAATRMFCAAPGGVMDLEAAFLSALEGAKRYHLAGETLRIFYDGGESVLTFSAGP